MTAAAPVRVVVAVCTYQRNGPLKVLLDALVVNAAKLGSGAAVGVVVVDDSRDGQARSVVESFEGRFALGIQYLRSGLQNISLARNMAVEAAAANADFVAMTDDDCEPDSHWLHALLDMQRRTGADAVSGPYHRRPPPGSPKWLTDAPFLDVTSAVAEDGASVSFAGTNNSLLSASWWKSHPEIRFPLNMGVLGGEDVVFYRSAHSAGLQIRFARGALITENESPSRATLRYQLWLFFWLGNGSYVTRRELRQATPTRMFLQGANHVRRALQRPVVRMTRNESPQLLYCLADVLFGVGELLGVLGLRVRHH